MVSGKLIFKFEIVWPSPSKAPVKPALELPMGLKPALLFQVAVSTASKLFPRA